MFIIIIIIIISRPWLALGLRLFPGRCGQAKEAEIQRLRGLLNLVAGSDAINISALKDSFDAVSAPPWVWSPPQARLRLGRALTGVLLAWLWCR